MPKRVLFSIPYGLAFRNIVCADILARSVEYGAEAVVLLPRVPEADRNVLRAELPPGVQVDVLKPTKPSLLLTYLKLLKQTHYARRTALDTFQIKYQRRRQQRPFFHWALVPIETFSQHLLSEQIVDRLLEVIPQQFERHYRRLLDRVRPDVVAITKPGYHPDELPLTKAARHLRIPVIAIDTTWDNMASKRPPYVKPGRLTVWNEWMRKEAVRYYGFSDEAVSLTGGTQFDILFQADRLPDRKTFLSRVGLDPARKLIVYSLNAPMFAPDNPGYIKLLLDGIASGRIAGRPNVVIRMHPFDLEGRYESAVGAHSSVRLERAFAVSSPGSAFECLPTHNAVSHYGALMVHSDILINQASTTSLDAMSTNTPVVNIAFDLTPTHPDTSIARVYGFTHYKRIVESGAVRLAYTVEEFYEALNTYLARRDVDADRRLEARRRFVTYTDGRSCVRIAEALLSAC